MKLRKCPACKNQVDAESDVCPVCGCSPVARRVRSAVIWGAALFAITWVVFHGHTHWPSLLHH